MPNIIIRKGLQKEVLFMGLKAVYINYFIGIGLLVIILTICLAMIISTWIALIIGAILLALLMGVLLFYSNTYGAKGFIKKGADRSKPNRIRIVNNFESCISWKNK